MEVWFKLKSYRTLRKQKSQYSAKKLEKEYQRYQGYKKIMSKFPGIETNKFKSLINNTYFLKSKKLIKW